MYPLTRAITLWSRPPFYLSANQRARFHVAARLLAEVAVAPQLTQTTSVFKNKVNIPLFLHVSPREMRLHVNIKHLSVPGKVYNDACLRKAIVYQRQGLAAGVLMYFIPGAEH